MSAADQPSMYQRLLGAEFERLHPAVQAYLNQPAGTAWRFDGEFTVAGCTVPALRPAFAALTAERMFFGEYGEHVPFSIVNCTGTDENGQFIHAVREIYYPNATRYFEDECRVKPDGEFVDRVGQHQLLSTGAQVGVTSRGALRIASDRAYFGPLYVPSLLAAAAYTEQGYDEQTGRLSIQTRVIQPVIGTIFAYAGSFDPTPTELSPAELSSF